MPGRPYNCRTNCARVSREVLDYRWFINRVKAEVRETGTALVGFDFPVESPFAMLETVVFPIFTAFPLCDRPRNGTGSLAQKAACTCGNTGAT
jgi:hypothetical protein